jgi:pimeloyl-ACP methyl ester carboxylesterase
MPPKKDTLLVTDRLIRHVSTIPAAAGRPVQMFLREKVLASVAARKAKPKVVLMIPGGIWPSTVTFDLPYRDYSWMEHLARAGLDVFALDPCGYGYSSRPLMDDPRNLPPKSRSAIGLDATAPSPDPYNLVTTDSETDELDRAVEAIRSLRGVDKVALLGWTGGGTRAGIYAARFPEKVERLIIISSSGYNRHEDGPPAHLPEAGHPVRFETRDHWEGRWRIEAKDQLEPGISDIVWMQSMETDRLGATWGPGGVRSPSHTYWGFREPVAKRITCPTLVMSGELDNLNPRNADLYAALGTSKKAFLSIADASHFMCWEKQRRVLHKVSAEWFGKGKIAGKAGGKFRADEGGKIKPTK